VQAKKGLPYKLASVASAAVHAHDHTAASAGVMACLCAGVLELGNVVLHSAGLTHPHRTCRACAVGELTSLVDVVGWK
jgi:trimethylamine:corrinoid methyltransferase-like protein